MEVPLIQGRSQRFLTRQSLGASRENALNPPSGYGPAGRNTPGQLFSDAARISFSRKAGAPPDAESAQSESVQPVLRKGFGENALLRLSELAKGITGIARELETATSDEIKGALENELASMRDQFDRITQGPEMRRLIEIATIARNSLGAGVDRDSLARALRSEAGLLGDRFIGLVSAGASANIDTFLGFLGELSSTSFGGPEDIARDAASALSKISRALGALEGSFIKESGVKEAVSENEVNQRIVVSQRESQYSLGSDIALAVKTYDSKGIIATAVTGAGTDPNDIFQIMIRAPKDTPDEETKQARRGEPPPGPFEP